MDELEAFLDERLVQRSHYVWENRILGPSIEHWLSNFDGRVLGKDIERILAKYLLTKYVFVSEKEIEHLCKMAYRAFLHDLLETAGAKALADVRELREDLLEDTRFYCLGRPGESGAYILYRFRQANNLALDLFVEPLKLGLECKVLCVVDDVSITGEQAERYSKQLAPITCEKKYAIVLFLGQLARKRLEDAGFRVISPIELKDDEVRFGPQAPAVADLNLELGGLVSRDQLILFCKAYGVQAWADHPLGFDQSALIMGLHHNVPDNTLPILWSNRGWKAIVNRRQKVEGHIPHDVRPFV